MKKLSDSWVMKAVIPYLILLVAIISAAFGIISAIQLERITEQVDQSITETGSYLASGPMIVDALEKG